MLRTAGVGVGVAAIAIETDLLILNRTLANNYIPASVVSLICVLTARLSIAFLYFVVL